MSDWLSDITFKYIQIYDILWKLILIQYNIFYKNQFQLLWFLNYTSQDVVIYSVKKKDIDKNSIKEITLNVIEHLTILEQKLNLFSIINQRLFNKNLIWYLFEIMVIACSNIYEQFFPLNDAHKYFNTYK